MLEGGAGADGGDGAGGTATSPPGSASSDAVLRTLQRRIRQWRAENGGEREIFFAQEHPPGRLGLSDFTVADELGVSIAGVALPHRLYQFAFAHSGWRHARVVLGGESFQALDRGTAGRAVDGRRRARGAPHRQPVGGVQQPGRTRGTDQALRANCASTTACEPAATIRGESHENGSIESRQGSLKRALDQALLLRGTREFADLAAYEPVRRRDRAAGSMRAARVPGRSNERACGRCQRAARPTSRSSMPGSASTACSPPRARSTACRRDSSGIG